MMKDIVVLTCSTLDHIRIPYVANFKIYVSVVVNIYCFVFSAIFQKFLFIVLIIKTDYEISFLSFINML